MEIAYMLATARYCAGQLAQAKPLFDAVVADDPSHADAWTYLGLIARKTGLHDVEVAMYLRALEADPNCILANVNLASRLMEEDAMKARSYLQVALARMAPENQHRACALDLMGNSYAYLEKDYLKESEYHRQAHRIESDNILYRDNLIISLISAGRPIDARQVWQNTKKMPAQQPLAQEWFLQIFCDETAHPYECLQLVDAGAA